LFTSSGLAQARTVGTRVADNVAEHERNNQSERSSRALPLRSATSPSAPLTRPPKHKKKNDFFKTKNLPRTNRSALEH